MSPDLSGPLPEPGQNNLWFHYNDSDSVIVFLHGIFFDSRSCWLHEDEMKPARSVYWPALVRSDQRFGDPAMYLAGFYTGLDAGPYEIRNCADEVFGALDRQDAEGRPGPMTKPTMVFVCHSTGGMVARYLLEESEARFSTKKLGLVLIASPSYGSKWADRLDLLAKLYNQQLGIQLQWGNWSLRDLDARFRNLLNQRRLPGLRGVEAYENHFVFHRRWLPNRNVVVTDESAGRYFGAPVLLRKTNHFTCVKPDSLRHPAHELLVDFWTKEMTKPLATGPNVAAPSSPAPRPQIAGTWESPVYGVMQLNQEGNLIFGAYDYSRQNVGYVYGQLQGKIEERYLKFAWCQDTSKQVPCEKRKWQGDGYFILSEDGNLLEGKWSRSRACCCKGVGCVTWSNASTPGSLGWMRFFTMVARSASKVWKLCTGSPSSVRFVCAFRRAV